MSERPLPELIEQARTMWQQWRKEHGTVNTRAAKLAISFAAAFAQSREAQGGNEPKLRYRCGCIVVPRKFHDDEDHAPEFICEPNVQVAANDDGAALGGSPRCAGSAIQPTTRCPKCPDTKVAGLYCSTCGYRLDGQKESREAQPKRAWRCDGCGRIYYEDMPLEDCDCKCTSFTFVGGEAQGEWVPVLERLPDEDELVLVSVWCESDDHDGVTQRWQEVHEATIYKTPLQLIATTADGQEYEGEEVEAWMPLPSPPLEKGSQP